MADSTQTCSRCDDPIPKPVNQNANYVLADDFKEPQKTEVVYGMFHTEETKKELDRVDKEFTDRDRQALAAEQAHPDADDIREVANGTKVVEHEGGEVETADRKEVAFSVPTEKYEHKEINDANRVQDDDEVALTYSTTEEREVKKTGVVCPNCTKGDDEIIWGVSM